MSTADHDKRVKAGEYVAPGGDERRGLYFKSKKAADDYRYYRNLQEQGKKVQAEAVQLDRTGFLFDYEAARAEAIKRGPKADQFTGLLYNPDKSDPKTLPSHLSAAVANPADIADMFGQGGYVSQKYGYSSAAAALIGAQPTDKDMAQAAGLSLKEWQKLSGNKQTNERNRLLNNLRDKVSGATPQERNLGELVSSRAESNI